MERRKTKKDEKKGNYPCSTMDKKSEKNRKVRNDAKLHLAGRNAKVRNEVKLCPVIKKGCRV